MKTTFKLSYLLSILCFCNVFAQEKSFTINWEAKPSKFKATTYSLTLPTFNKANFSYNETKGLFFVNSWKVNSAVDENSISVSNVAYQAITKKDLKDLNLKTIPETLTYSLKNATARNRRYAQFKMSPIIKDENGTYKKVTSFKIQYTNASANANRNSNGQRTVYNSVMANGQWYRFSVAQTGVHIITKEFLEQLGINAAALNPNTIKVYGNGGHMLPYANAANYPTDIQENSVQVVGGEDGIFNDQDYILFYGEGPYGYNEDSRTNLNLYTDKSYYYIALGLGESKRALPMLEPIGATTFTVNKFNDYQFYEHDENNIALLGRRWFGDNFDEEPTQNFEFNFPNLDTSVPVNLEVYVAAASRVDSQMEVSFNGASVSTINLAASTNSNLGNPGQYVGSLTSSSPNISVGLTYNNNSNPSAEGYLDYIALNAVRDLTFAGSQMPFVFNQSATLGGIGEYEIANASLLHSVWDITNPYNITFKNNTNASATFTFKARFGEERRYIALANTNFIAPIPEPNPIVFNQNLKGTIFLNRQGNFQDIDYLIITDISLYNQAEQLAQINRVQNGLNVKVVTVDLIYNEFSSGNPDIAAIRNFVKYVYDNASAPENRVKYLCLFGDTSIDYKDRLPRNNNIVPSWHAYNSFNLTNAFLSDDFYGNMDADEGTMESSDLLDIAVGRVIADTPTLAQQMVNKINAYYSVEALGDWRNRIVVTADDVDEDWEEILQRSTNEVADEITTVKPFFNVTKIFSDSFLQESSAGGERYPTATEAMVNAISKGALFVNYLGHGGEDGLSAERLFFVNDVRGLTNNCKFNCFVTVTCEFTKFDNPLRLTAGEYLYWNSNGGTVSLLTTTRQIFVTTGVDFNEVLSSYLFSYNPDDDYSDYEYPSVAEALRLTKNDPSLSNRDQKLLIFSIGDPALKLKIPRPNIRLTKINDQPISGTTETLQALSQAKLSGEVTDLDGNVITGFNGVLTATVFDKNAARETLANDGTRDSSNDLIKLEYNTLGEIVFKGQATITNGEFEFEFVVPRDIAIPEGVGKVSFYAKRGSTPVDVAGADVTNLRIGGLNEDAPEDNDAPLISLFMNDYSFVSGGITNQSPTLLAKLQDTNGINTSSGIGHDIVAILDGDETNPYVLNDYYQADLDTYKSGVVSFPFTNLSTGIHTLTLKAWDVYNNSSTQDIQFVVYNENEQLVVNNVLNYPNPFVDYTEFWFNHNSTQPLDVLVQIFTVSGKLVKTIKAQTNTSTKSNSSLSRDIVWDGRDDFGDKIGKGVYIYKLTVRSPFLNKQVEKIEKLVIL